MLLARESSQVSMEDEHERPADHVGAGPPPTRVISQVNMRESVTKVHPPIMVDPVRTVSRNVTRVGRSREAEGRPRRNQSVVIPAPLWASLGAQRLVEKATVAGDFSTSGRSVNPTRLNLVSSGAGVRARSSERIERARSSDSVAIGCPGAAPAQATSSVVALPDRAARVAPVTRLVHRRGRCGRAATRSQPRSPPTRRMRTRTVP